MWLEKQNFGFGITKSANLTFLVPKLAEYCRTSGKNRCEKIILNHAKTLFLGVHCIMHSPFQGFHGKIKSRVNSPNNQFELFQSHKIQMTSTMCSTGFPHVLKHKTMTRYKFTKSCPHLPTMNSHPVLMAAHKLRWCPTGLLESPNSLVLGSHSAFFFENKNLKVIIIYSITFTSSPWALGGLWYVESANSMTVAKSTSNATKNLSSNTPRTSPPIFQPPIEAGNMFKASTTCSAHSFWFHTSENTVFEAPKLVKNHKKTAARARFI